LRYRAISLVRHPACYRRLRANSHLSALFTAVSNNRAYRYVQVRAPDRHVERIGPEPAAHPELPRGRLRAR